jgi:peptide deformylase
VAIKNILIWPDSRLLQKSVEVTEFGQSLRDLLTDMKQTMESAKGLGLAAIQIGIPLRALMAIIDGKASAIINPKIISLTNPIDFTGEGCLSLPGILFDTKRFNNITIDFLTEDKIPMALSLNGLEAVEIQHEIDHLNGQLLVLQEGVGKVRRDMIKRKLLKFKRLQS